MMTQAPQISDDDLEAEGLFRGGFVAALRSDIEQIEAASFAILRKWFDRREIGAYSVFIAPGTLVLELQTANGTVLAIGDVFDNDGDATPDARLRAIASAPDLPRAIAQSDLGGRHAVLIIRDAELHVFNDPMGTRSVHFLETARRAISSHAGLLAKLFGADIAPDVAKYVASPQYLTRTVNYLPGNRTMYQDIQRLLPNHLLSLPDNKMKRFWPHEPRKEGREETLHRRFDSALNALRVHVANRYLPVVGLTGGADSRVVCTNFHLAGQPFIGMTWVDINFKQKERESINRVRDLTGQPHYDIARHSISDGGRYRALGILNSGGAIGGVRGELMGTVAQNLVRDGIQQQPVFVLGYGGEIIRGFYRLARRDDNLNFNAQTMLNLFGVTTKKAGPDSKVSSFVMRSFQEFFKEGQFGPEAMMGYDPLDLFYWEHRMGMWATLTLETIDPAMHCLEGMNSRRLFEAALNLPNAQRLSKEVLHRYIIARSPEMGAIPIV